MSNGDVPLLEGDEPVPPTTRHRAVLVVARW